MQLKKLLWILLGAAAFLFSCKKETNFLSPISSLTIVNAFPDNPNIVAVFSDTTVPFYINVAPIFYGTAVEYGNQAGATPVIITSAADTSSPLFKGSFDLKSGGLYSLFIAGQVKSLDTLFIQDILPLHEDSSAGLRFINLSPGSQPISVNLEGNDPSQTEFAGLAYKQISEFKTYASNSTNSFYNFEIRDQTSGNLLTTFFWNTTIHKNNTLVISGSEDPASTNPIQVFQVNNY